MLLEQNDKLQNPYLPYIPRKEDSADQKWECNFFSLLCLISHSLTFKILEGRRLKGYSSINVGELEWKHRIWITLMDAFSSSPLSSLLTCRNLRCLSLTENSLIDLKFQRSFQFRPRLKNTDARAKLGGYCSWVEFCESHASILQSFLNSSRSFSKHHGLIRIHICLFSCFNFIYFQDEFYSERSYQPRFWILQTSFFGQVNLYTRQSRS